MSLSAFAGRLGLALGPALWRVTAAAAWSQVRLSGFVPAREAPPMCCSMALIPWPPPSSVAVSQRQSARLYKARAGSWLAQGHSASSSRNATIVSDKAPKRAGGPPDHPRGGFIHKPPLPYCFTQVPPEILTTALSAGVARVQKGQHLAQRSCRLQGAARHLVERGHFEHVPAVEHTRPWPRGRWKIADFRREHYAPMPATAALPERPRH